LPSDSNVAQRLEHALLERYGAFPSVQPGHSYLLSDGTWSGNLIHHTPASRYALQQAGITPAPGAELIDFMAYTGAIRIDYSNRELHVQLEGDMTLQQMEAICEAYRGSARFLYEAYSPDGEEVSSGEGLLEFLDDPLVAEALERGKSKYFKG
jgi:hypothetical protein